MNDSPSPAAAESPANPFARRPWVFRGTMLLLAALLFAQGYATARATGELARRKADADARLAKTNMQLEALKARIDALQAQAAKLKAR